MTTPKNPYRQGTKAAERWEARQAREREKQAKIDAKDKRKRDTEEQVSAGLALAAKPPASFGDWGVIRTRAWMKVSTQLRRWCRVKRPNLEKLIFCCQLLERVNDGTLTTEGCQKLLNEKITTATEVA